MKQRVLLRGKDGIDLLHRMSTLDLKHPKTKDKTVGLILNPQGKIRSSFWIMLQSPDAAILEFEGPLLEIIDQFTFGEHYEIIKLDPASEPERGERDRILAMSPKLDHEFKNNEETNPLEINLRLAVHDQKGCYPGQEVIEKIISLGSPAKRLCLLEGPSTSISCPVPLVDINGKEAGTLTSYDQTGNYGIGLGIIKRSHLKENESLKAGIYTLLIRKISGL